MTTIETTAVETVNTSIMLPTIRRPFIEANTQELQLNELQNDCIIPRFAKDNERTIAHQEFIGATQEALSEVFPNFEAPEIRVSHPIKGCIPEAIYKSPKELLDHEKTVYFERMAFIIRIPEITDVINGNKLSLTIGGVRAYNNENLGSRKTLEKFKFFIGFQNLVCCNLCISTDGFLSELKVSTIEELRDNVLKTIHSYEAQNHLNQLKEFTNYSLTESEFAQLIGKTRLHGHLPKAEKALLPKLEFNDSHFNQIAKDYYTDHAFSKERDGNINLWDVYNLFTQANRNSYIDTMFDRGLNAFDLTNGLLQAKQGDPKYQWFIN